MKRIAMKDINITVVVKMTTDTTTLVIALVIGWFRMAPTLTISGCFMALEWDVIVWVELIQPSVFIDVD